MFIRDGSLYFRGEGGWAISKKDPAQQKLTKYRARGVTRKKLSKYFYYHYFDFFYVKKKSCTSYCPPKKLCTPEM